MNSNNVVVALEHMKKNNIDILPLDLLSVHFWSFFHFPWTKLKSAQRQKIKPA